MTKHTGEKEKNTLLENLIHFTMESTDRKHNRLVFGGTLLL